MVESNNDLPEGYKMTELGPLPEDWDITRLGENVVKTKQKDMRKTSDEFEYIDVSGIDRDSSRIISTTKYKGNKAPSRARKIVKENDVIIATVRPTLKRIALIPKKYDDQICSTAFCVLRGNEDLDNRYIYYIIQQNSFIDSLGKIQRGASYPAVTDSDIKNQVIPLPPLPEQRRIAVVLSSVQEARETTEAVIRAAKELKKSMMKHLFTYGPVPPSEAENVPLKETEIGMVPEDWNIINIGTLANVQGGYAFKSRDYTSEGIPVFRISNVSFGKTSWDDIAFLPNKYSKDYKKYLLKEGDLVMAMTRPIVTGGIKITRLKKSDIPCLLNQRVCRFLPKKNINIEFLFQMLFNKYFLSSISNGALGSQQPNISAKKIENILIPFPKIIIQDQIAEILTSLDLKLEAEENKKKAQDDLFKTLLNDLMTATIRVNHLNLEVVDT
jgi:type I restriction enzyme S subunit